MGKKYTNTLIGRESIPDRPISINTSSLLKTWEGTDHEWLGIDNTVRIYDYYKQKNVTAKIYKIEIRRTNLETRVSVNYPDDIGRSADWYTVDQLFALIEQAKALSRLEIVVPASKILFENNLIEKIVDSAVVTLKEKVCTKCESRVVMVYYRNELIVCHKCNTILAGGANPRES